MVLMPKILMVLAGLTLSSGTPLVGNEDMIEEDTGRCNNLNNLTLMNILCL